MKMVVVTKILPKVYLYLAISCATLFNSEHVFAQISRSIPLDAKSYVLIDAYTHQVIAENNANDPVHPASLTKLMTAYLAFDAVKHRRISLDQRLPVSKRAWDERLGNGTLMFLAMGMSPTMDELLSGLIVQSGNDAAVVLAEAIGGSVEGFVQMMNYKAKEWDLKNTNFVNSTGLTNENHKMSAMDAAKIMSQILEDHPKLFHSYFSLKEYTFNGIRQLNRNALLDIDHGFDGGKTGYTDAAGYCLATTSHRKDENGHDRRLISIVMGATSKDSRKLETLKLVNWGFSAFRWEGLFEKDRVVKSVRVWQGDILNVELVVDRDVSIAVPKETDRKNLVIDFEVDEPLTAPLEKGQQAGWVKIMTRDGVFISRHPLLVSREIIKGSYPKRLFHAFIIHSKNLVNQFLGLFSKI